MEMLSCGRTVSAIIRSSSRPEKEDRLMPPPDSSPSIQAISRPRSELTDVTATVPSWMLVVVAIVSVQIGAAVAKQLFDVVSPSGVVFLRTVLAAVMFAFLRPRLLGYRWQAYLKIGFYG